MIRAPFDHVTTWVFDLDNTLYPPSIRLFDQIEVRMTAYVMQALRVARDEADHLRDLYWRRHGTTLAGLMREHGVDPLPYLRDVHDIDFAAVTPDPQLTAGIARLPGRRIVYTNGSADYARRVIAARGLAGLFDAVYGIEDAGFHPKPDRAAYDIVFTRDGLTAERAAMFEDDARNLEVPHAMGLTTIHVAPGAEPHPFIQHHTTDLSAFLTRLTAGLPATA
jgi:putative hydrolase of the HAD superfamily